MRPIALLLIVVSISAAAGAAPNGVPAKIRTLGSWRQHDPSSPETGEAPWSPSDVVALLALYPDAYLDAGQRDAEPPGNTHWLGTGKQVEQAQAIARSRGVSIEGRVCVSERPDVMTKMVRESGCDPSQGGGGCAWEGDMDGSLGEPETAVEFAGRATGGAAAALADASAHWDENELRHRLLVLRPNGPGEERRRITGNDATNLTVSQPFATPAAPGNRYEVRGSFDPAWVKRVARADHAATVQSLWTQLRNVCPPGHACDPPAQPLDPFDPANQRSWVSWMDRSALLALASPSSLPALYGWLGDGRRGLEFSHFEQDPFFYVSASVMDLGNPSYRAWRIRYLLYKLADYGIAPSDGACLMEAYKPGWYGYYDDVARGSSNDTCSVPGTHLWTGPAHVCSDGRAPGGPFDSGLYGPGEFEVGLNAYFRELFAALAAAGYTDVRIITTERPSYGPEIWSLLDPDVKASPQLVGEWDAAIEPSLGQIAAQGPKSGPPATPPPSPQAPPSPSTPQPPAASDGGSPPAADPVAPSPAAPAPRERRHRSDGRFLPAEDGGGDAVILAPSLKGVR